MNHLEKIIQRTEQRVETLKSTFSRENLQSNGKEYKKRKFVEILHKSVDLYSSVKIFSLDRK